MGWEYFAIAIVLMVASYVITAATMPKPQERSPATIDQFEFPQFEEGTPQIVVFGDVWLKDWMVLYYGDFRVEAMKGKSGKK